MKVDVEAVREAGPRPVPEDGIGAPEPGTPPDFPTLLRGSGYRRSLLLFFLEHFLGERRFDDWFGPVREKCRESMRRRLDEVPKGERMPVSEMRFTSHADFLAATYGSSEPVVFRDAARKWRAVREWDFDFFATRHAQTRAVVIDHTGLIGENERQDYEVSTIGRLIDAIRSGEMYYLRFSPVMKENPELLEDLDMAWLRGFRSRFSQREEPQLFIGPAGTYTPLHCALECNVFVQIRGRKRWLCYPASYLPLLDVRAERRPYFSSEVRPGRSAAEHPLADHAPVREVVLEPGDVLWVPPFAWHHVENLTDIVAVGYRYHHLRWGFRTSWPLFVLKFLATRPSIPETVWYSLTRTSFLYKPRRR